MDDWGIWGWLTDRVVAPVVVALIFSWVVAMLIERHRAKREFLSKEVESARVSLNEYWSLASEYWGSDTIENPLVIEERLQLLEEENLAVTIDLGEYFGAEFRKEAVTLCADLSEATTKSPFGEPERLPSRERVMGVREAVVALRSALQISRRKNLDRVFGVRVKG